MLPHYSAICLRHVASGRFLSSRAKRYRRPPGSGQQIVFATEKISDESWWIVKPPHGASEGDLNRSEVGKGAVIRLEHRVTKKNLHTHSQFKSPLTGQQETTAFGSFGFGNEDDNWKIELVGDGDFRPGAKILLHHVRTDKVLHSHKGHASKELTDGEQEVTSLTRGDDNDYWELAEIDATAERKVSVLISLAADGRFGPLSFYSIDDFSGWLSREETFWSWINEVPGVVSLTQLRDGLFTEIKNNLNEAARGKDGDNAPSLVENVKSVAARVFEGGKWLVSDEPRAKFIAGVIGERGKAVAAGALAYIMHAPLMPAQTRETFEGAATAFAHEAGLAGVAANEIASFKVVRQSAEQEARQLMGEREELHRRTAEMVAAFDRRTTLQINEWEEKRRGADKRLEDLEQTYHRKIGVESSVAYWKRKARFNFALSCVFALAGFAAEMALFVFIAFVAMDLLSVEKIGVHDYWRFAILIFLVTAAIWLGRLFVRLIFGNLHQWTDANERQTMIQTYLALRKEGYLPDNKDISLVLGVLFRPGDSGLLKDERGPATPVEIMDRLVDRWSSGHQ